MTATTMPAPASVAAPRPPYALAQARLNRALVLARRERLLGATMAASGVRTQRAQDYADKQTKRAVERAAYRGAGLTSAERVAAYWTFAEQYLKNSGELE